ncbi:twin-arginine translocase TatA/TatE family subunit [Leptospirillum ferriphilum]|jgi:sec-independent protein translocase protein TatA|uniref:twin-arginine translocase TatA/TatE family subunit n=1 Tax=Leptospirillum ferriphilum TaxID=178606 RepID=UPI0006B22AAD|nr:twin-arginine translocase TatA/TatE family subunit [Leptospirillum ferriphilum]
MLSGLFEPIHLIVILGIVLLLFGGKKLPEIGSGLGKAISNFRQSFKNEEGSGPSPEREASAKRETESKPPLSR